MTFVKKPVALALLAVAAAAFSVSAQTSALNPTVKVLARPQSPVPAECATDVSTTAPAIEPEPQPAPDQVITIVPPSNDLRASMRRLQVAAEGDDYAVFKAALNEARRAIASHPPGGERNAANDALQVFVDIGRVWDYAMASPAGSFFDGTVQGGSLLSALRRYPDYGKTIAGETLVVGDKTLYPTRETRRFLARESSRRLGRLGVSTPARVAQGAQPEAWPHRPTAAPPVQKKAAEKRPAQVTAKTPAKTKSTPKPAQVSVAPKPHETKHKPAEKTAKAAPKTPRIESTPVPRAKPAPPPPEKIATTATLPTGPPIVTTTTAAPPPPVPTTTTAVPPPTATTATTTTTAPATDTTTSSATTSSTDTTATAAPDTAATSTAPPAEKQNGNMNLLLAVVLILVGIGVLVILFRASD